MVDKTNKLLRDMKQNTAPIVPIGDGMILPNHSGVSNHKELKEFKITPSSMDVVVGSLDSGDVNSVKVWADGNIVHLDEVASTPGYDLRFTFSNVLKFDRIGISAYYQGSTTHHCEIQLYDNSISDWRTIWTFSNGGGQNYRYSDLPSGLQEDYINSNKEVLLRFYHPVSGNASHELFVDFVSLCGRTA